MMESLHFVTLFSTRILYLDTIAQAMKLKRMFDHFLEHLGHDMLMFVQQLCQPRKCNYLTISNNLIFIFAPAAAMKKFQFQENIFQFF